MNVLKVIGKVLVVLALIALIGLGIITLQKFATEPRDAYLQGQMEARRVLVAGKVPGRVGQMEARRVLVAGKVPGRVEQLFFREGDMVEKNAIVAIISSPEIEAKKIQAQGALGAARAQANKAKNGARSEDITALKAMASRAQDAANLAKNTYDRVQKLYNEGVLPLQKRDEAETQMKASAKGANAEVDAYLEETKIRAPIAGEVSVKLVEEGEVVGSGMPVVAITDLDDSWAVFHLREDLLKNVSKGKTFSMFIPALDKNVEMEVSYIASVGDYATWRSSKESGGFDLKSFEVRLRPKAKIENLRPGMSVLFPVEQIQ